ncbi:hypothetical protein BD626DRAFT_508641 [Schizophyllum amplum]|uniref:Uncharacterized protein n=1 Tax=Schizophyllum amplum TaxID=97359 RepID=A0A550C334_9AGAR|nr:hypothetical protein BD626DRAFT_508641 [Auriculariopsis ampla]
MVDSFWEDIGHDDDRDYKAGEILYPSKKWIRASTLNTKTASSSAAKSGTKGKKQKVKRDCIDYDDVMRKNKVKKESLKEKSRRKSIASASPARRRGRHGEPSLRKIMRRVPSQKGKKRATSSDIGNSRAESTDESDGVSHPAKKTAVKPEAPKLKKRKRPATPTSDSEDDVRTLSQSPTKKKQKPSKPKHSADSLFSDAEEEDAAPVLPHPPPKSAAPPSSSTTISPTEAPKKSYEKRGVQLMDSEITGYSTLPTKSKLAGALKFTKISKQQKEAAGSASPTAASPSTALVSAPAGPASAGPSKPPLSLPTRKLALPRRKDSVDIGRRNEPPASAKAPNPADLFLQELASERDFAGLTQFMEAEVEEPQHVCDMRLFNVTVRRDERCYSHQGRLRERLCLSLLWSMRLLMATKAGFATNEPSRVVRFFVTGFEETLCELFECPDWYKEEDVLYAALVPWKIIPVVAPPDEHVSMYQFNEAAPSLRAEPLPPAQIPPALEAEFAGRWTMAKGEYQQALHVLQIPHEVLDFLQKQERTFYIHAPSDEYWPNGESREYGPGRTNQEEIFGYETRLLLAVLRQAADKKKGVVTALERTVWIHVGSLKDLGKIPMLIERLNQYDTNFYSYGTHPSVPRQMWGIHTLFTYGGAATFTPRALLDDPITVYSLMEQLHEHPAWCCYILPCVLGMAVRLYYKEDNPMAIFDRDPESFVFSRILQTIDDGKCAFMTAPPPYMPSQPSVAQVDSPKQQDTHDQWVGEQGDVLAMLDTREILEHALNVYDHKVAGRKATEVDADILNELQDDFAQMQIQPPILYDHRRFIIVRGPRDHSLNKERFECLTVDQLIFEDGFFDLTLR